MNNLESLQKELEVIEQNSISKFSFKNYKTLIKIIRVIDGDSVVAIFKFNNQFYKYNFRINGIDTPEINSKNEYEKKKGIDTKIYVQNLLINKILFAEFLDFDKYGRILLNLYLNSNENISEHLINGGYANKYDGGGKSSWI
jgi:endonuclease YncB( thermonuclease family)